MINSLKQYGFLFEELVARDFKQKYKRTALGMLWSILSPLLNLLVMSLVFTHFFGHQTPHYTIYLFCGNLVFSYFKESTSQGMRSLLGNADIFTKVNIPKYLFVLSRNVSSFINFFLTLCVFFLFCIFDKVHFGWHFFMLLYPILCLMIFNIGMGFVLSALFVFFRDTAYLYDVFTLLLMYMSAIFYTIDSFPILIQRIFLCNPVYAYIHYMRVIVLDGNIPSLQFHFLCAFYAVAMLLFGIWIYKKNNDKFLYYV